ncbi:MAG: hypothetical protein C3F17_03610 [Bradyrhizobiaceae bacterium]|nr:MAG: hypothetical protein C3F17_03610 [Bradyrhizobiaceae bacterium]
MSVLLAPAARLHAALTDPARRERTVLLVLAAYVAIWTLYAIVAKGSQDLHFDMGEVVVWSREVGWGGPKHPALAPWLAGAWFRLVPLSDATFYLLAMAVAAAGLWIAWRVSADYLDPDKRVAGLALLTLLPFFNLQALKYNANTVLIPLWAATTWCFLRSFETRNIAWAALAGAAAAAAVLGKYWSVFLLAGLGVAALADPRRRAYFASAAPWVTLAVGALLIAPHLVWLVANDFVTVHYARGVHDAETYARAARDAGLYLLGAVAYLALPVGLAMLAARPSRAALLDSVWPAGPERRLAAVAFLAPLLLPVLVAPAAQLSITSLWTMSGMTLLPVLLLASPQVALSPAAAVRVLALALVVPLVMVLASPLIAAVIHRTGVPHGAAHYRQVAGAVERIWTETSAAPLRIVGSHTELLYGIGPYLARQPSLLEIVNPQVTPWVDGARVAREGAALVCPASHGHCMRALAAWMRRGDAARRVEIEISRTHFGVPGPSARYLVGIVAPRE